MLAFSCKPTSPPAAVTQVHGALAHHVKDKRRSYWVADGFRVAATATAAKNLQVWIRRGQEKLHLTPERTAVREGRVLHWFSTSSVAVGQRFELLAGATTHVMERVPSPEVWPRIASAKTATNSEAALNLITQEPQHPLEELAAIKEQARARSRMGDLAGYRRIQETRAERSLQLSLPSVAADSLSAAAFYALLQQDYAGVEELSGRAEKIASRNGYVAGVVQAQMMLGQSQYDVGRLRRTTQILQEAANTAWRTGNDDDMAWAQFLLAPIYQALGLHDRALQLFRQAEPFFRNQKGTTKLSYLVDHGWVLAQAMEQGVVPVDWNRPAVELREAVKLAQSLGNPRQESNAHLNLAFVQYAAGDFDAAHLSLDARDRLQTSSRNTSGFSRLLRGRLYLEAGEAERARSCALAARGPSNARRALALDLSWQVQLLLGRAEWRLGNVGAAETAWDQAMLDVERLARTTPLQDTRAAFLDDRRALYALVVQKAIGVGDLVRAFETIERYRTLVLDAFRQRVEDNESPKILAAEANYQRARHALEQAEAASWGILSGKRREHDSQLKKLQIEVRASFDALTALKDEQSILRNGERNRFSVVELQKRLAPDQRLLSFFALKDLDLSFIVSADGLKLVKGPHESFDWDQHLAGARAAVVIAGAKREHLFAQAATAVLPTTSLSLLPSALFVPPEPTGTVKRWLIAADPERNLPHANDEGHWLKSHLPSVQLLAGAQATRAQVAPALEVVEGFHFAGHGLLNANDPWQIRLQLAEGSNLNLQDLLVKGLHLQRVVLSGCETGRARTLRGDHVVGLPEAFMLGGTRSVLATFARVSDVASARFIRAFYRAGGAEHPVLAYQKAALAQQREGLDDWKAFYVMGAGK